MAFLKAVPEIIPPADNFWNSPKHGGQWTVFFHIVSSGVQFCKLSLKFCFLSHCENIAVKKLIRKVAWLFGPVCCNVNVQFMACSLQQIVGVSLQYLVGHVGEVDT